MTVSLLRQMYPKGTKVRLIKMTGENHMPQGLTGTVTYVDDIMQIHVNWENGSTLALQPNKDCFEIYKEENK